MIHNQVKIRGVSVVRPEFEYTTPEIVAYLEKTWLKTMAPEIRRMALRIIEGAEIEKRAAPFPIEVVFSDITFKQKNDLYTGAAIKLAEQALTKALSETGTRADEIDYIITTSCTGFMIPSVDAYLVDKLGLRQNVRRLPVTEMGCAGGTAALIYAHDIARAHPDMTIAIVSVEIPSITFQSQDVSMENLVSTAIFADGAAAVILGPTEEVRPAITATEMYHFPDSTHLMGYQLHNSGLKIVLDREVPETIHQHFDRIFFGFLERHHVKPEAIENYMFHPGGKKIIARVEDFIGRYGKDISTSRSVLRECGNLSSATILHILERVMKQSHNAGELGYMLAFGPGFTAQSLLVKWQ